jgi:hypothetical protein
MPRTRPACVCTTSSPSLWAADGDARRERRRRRGARRKRREREEEEEECMIMAVVGTGGCRDSGRICDVSRLNRD